MDAAAMLTKPAVVAGAGLGDGHQAQVGPGLVGEGLQLGHDVAVELRADLLEREDDLLQVVASGARRA